MAKSIDGNGGANPGESIESSGSDLEAVASGGTDNGALDPSATIARTGRGRHPKSCGCDKCTKRNADSGKVEKERTAPKSQASTKLDLNTLGKQIVGVHMIAATLFKNETFLITESQGEALAVAIRDIAKFHSIPIGAETLSWLKLAGVASVIYVPKVMLASKAASEKRAAEKQRRDIMGATAVHVKTPAETQVDLNHPQGVYKFQ